MASEYAYYIDGRKLAILKKFQDTTDGVVKSAEYWGTPDAVDDNAIMVQYNPRITAPTNESDEIDVSDFLALAIVEYVKHRIAEDMGEYDRSRFHYKQFIIKMNENEDNRRGGSVIMAPPAHALR